MTLLSQTVMARCDAVAQLTETPGAITRTYLSAEHAKANRLVGGWMAEAGMTVRIDAVGSVVGRYDGIGPDAPMVVLGSHLDSVRNAGRYDGVLGVILSVAVVQGLAAEGRRLPIAIEVVGFGEEEGVRFGTSLIGSHALAGRFDPAWLGVTDQAGITLSQAMIDFGLDPKRIADAARRPGDIVAYLEPHIEQGPVLESLGLPVGLVTAICGATRRRIRVSGMAGHAGTVPMQLRRDALAGAAEMVLAIETIATRRGVKGTVGRISVKPDATNVIPGDALFNLDLRAERDTDRIAALTEVDSALEAIAARRGLRLSKETFDQAPSVPCAPELCSVVSAAIGDVGLPVHSLPSGAGHDAMAIHALAPVGMLFIRCREGISHNPAEAVLEEDVAVAGQVLRRVLERLAERG